MTSPLPLNRAHPGPYGQAITLSPLVRRVVANNPGPFTFTGTVTHLIGHSEVAVLDPGPDDGDHLQALLAATAGEKVALILVSHTHRDHTDGVAALRAATGAPVWGCTPVPASSGGAEADTETEYRPERVLADGELVSGSGWSLEVVATPGYSRNHLAFALREEKALFSGDHVMAWSSTVVAPPDGNMQAYRASLRRLLEREEDLYYPAHGPSLPHAKRHVAALLAHREAREAQILELLAERARTIPDLVDNGYPGLAPELRGGAALSVRAHLEELEARGAVARTGELWAQL